MKIIGHRLTVLLNRIQKSLSDTSLLKSLKKDKQLKEGRRKKSSIKCVTEGSFDCIKVKH